MEMGSTNYTFEQASNRLQRSKRMIHNYVAQGLLTKVVENGTAVLTRESVELMAVELGTDAPAMNRKTFLRQEARIKKLEDEMNAVKFILEIRDVPLRPSETEAKGLYLAASDAMSRRGWVLDEILLWAKQFERLDEVALDMIGSAVGEPKPWRPFYELCLEMMKEIDTSKGIESAALHRRLDEGRKKMRGTILLWIEMGRGSVPDNLLRLVDTPKETVLRRASKGRPHAGR